MAWWCSVMSHSHRITGGATDEAFEEQCSLWENGVYRTFYMYKNLKNTEGKKENKKEA